MPHYVNDASDAFMNLRIDRRRQVSPAGAIQAEVNCSLCTCAGVVMHATGTPTTSGAVAAAFPFTGTLASEFGGSRPAYQHSQTFCGTTYSVTNASDIGRINNAQAAGILAYVRNAVGAALTIGYEMESQALANAIAEMRALGTEFIFAVLMEKHGHWNFAHNKRDGVEFVDYQSSHPTYGGASRGAQPRLGIRDALLYDGNARLLVFNVPGYRPTDYDC